MSPKVKAFLNGTLVLTCSLLCSIQILSVFNKWASHETTIAIEILGGFLSSVTLRTTHSELLRSIRHVYERNHFTPDLEHFLPLINTSSHWVVRRSVQLRDESAKVVQYPSKISVGQRFKNDAELGITFDSFDRKTQAVTEDSFQFSPDFNFSVGFIHEEEDSVICSGTFKRVWLGLQILYHSTHYKLLPFPYATNCEDYRSRGYRSQCDCYAQCVRRLLKDCDELPITVHLEAKQSNLKREHEACNASKWDRMSFCAKHCQQLDCSFVTYHDIVETGTSYRKRSLSLKQEGSQKIEYLPLFTFLDVLIYLAGTISFWFGFSICSLGLLHNSIWNQIENESHHLAWATPFKSRKVLNEIIRLKLHSR